MDTKALEAKFDSEMRDLYYEAAKVLRYRATRFLNMVNENGGVKTAKLLLQSDEGSDGFTKLWEGGRLDLSVEARVLKPEYAPLFSDEEREQTRIHLARVRYTAPWDEGR